MITEGGIGSILKAFASENKAGHRISTLELGHLVQNDEEDDSVSFVPVHIHTIQPGQIMVIDYKTLRVSVIIDSDDILYGYDVLEYTYIRLACVNGDEFAWQSFPPRTLGAGLRATINWEVSLIDLVDDMLDKAHRHGDKTMLDKLGEAEDGQPTFNNEKLNIPRWKGDI